MCATPILYLNMGGEMLYVLQQRLQTQKISPDKTIIVINDVIYAMFNPKQLQRIFSPGPLMSLATLRPILESVVLSSIMKLDGNSMNKLFDLMIMMVKYQLATVTGPREVILSTLNHIDAIRDMAVDRVCSDHVDAAYRMIMDTYGKMTYKEIWQIRNDCLQEIQDHSVRVSILLRLGLQNQDATFNRLIQRYDEQYRERKEVLENIKLVDYIDDESIMGSLSIYGDRVTLLGKNVYSSCYGRVRSTKSSQNLLQQSTPVSNKSMRKELETLATQLGKEETMPIRPFSLHLFNNENDNDRNCMDCTPDNSKLDGANNDEKDAEGNYNNQPVNEYKNNLVENVNSEFSDNEPLRTEAMDLMNLLDVV